VLVVFFWGALGGCPQPETEATPDTRPADVEVDVDTEVADAVDTIDFETLAARYGHITTIAGRGRIDGDGVDGWLPTYSGGPAIAAELSRPHIAMVDAAGVMYIADKDAHA